VKSKGSIHFSFVSAAISSLPSAVPIVSPDLFAAVACSNARENAIAVVRVGAHGVIEQYRIAAFQRDAQGRRRFDAPTNPFSASVAYLTVLHVIVDSPSDTASVSPPAPHARRHATHSKRSPDERSDIRGYGPACRFAHAGYYSLLGDQP
jgi:hypothetical protein